MTRVVYVPTKKTFILAGLLIFLILAPILWKIGINHLESNWQDEMSSPGIENKLIIIDPGHGGADPGAMVKEAREADINLLVARELKKELEILGASAILTREEKGPLVPKKRMNYSEWVENLLARKDFALKKRGHIFISIHANTSQSKAASGSMVFYTDRNPNSKSLAENIQNKTNEFWGVEKKPQEKEFSVIVFDAMPSILVEIGFLTNEHDYKIMLDRDGRKKIAQAIGSGIKEFCDNLPQKDEQS